MKLELNLNDKQLESLAQVLKRIGFDHIRALSLDDDEAYNAQYALEEIRKKINEKGFNPR